MTTLVTPLADAFLRGDPLWPLPQSSLPGGTLEMIKRQDIRHFRMMPPMPPGFLSFDADPVAVTWRDVAVQVDAWRAEYRMVPVANTEMQRYQLDDALRHLMADLSDRLVDQRRVALAPIAAEVVANPDSLSIPGACVLRVRVDTVEALSGLTVERVQEERQSPGLLPGIHIVVEDPRLEEGLVLADRWNRTLTVGARPLSWAHREALERVRTGLADVLAWLGEPVQTPMHHEVMWAVRTGKGPGWPAVLKALTTGSSARPQYGRSTRQTTCPV